MVTVKLRKVGGSMMLAIPPSVLEVLAFGSDAPLSLSVSKGKLTVAQAKPRHRLEDLLAEHETSREVDPDWLDMPSVGGEI
jgi:antitoxin ChpS